MKRACWAISLFASHRTCPLVAHRARTHQSAFANLHKHSPLGESERHRSPNGCSDEQMALQAGRKFGSLFAVTGEAFTGQAHTAHKIQRKVALSTKSNIASADFPFGAWPKRAGRICGPISKLMMRSASTVAGNSPAVIASCACRSPKSDPGKSCYAAIRSYRWWRPPSRGMATMFPTSNTFRGNGHCLPRLRCVLDSW